MNLPEAGEHPEWRDGDKESAGTLAGANQIGAFFREGLAPKAGFGRRCPAGRQPIALLGAPLSFFGTANGKTDAKNPQVNR
jgi:hypothetical protein